MSRFSSHVPVALALAGFLATSSAALSAPVTDNTPVSGVWLDAGRAAQGLMIEQLDPPDGAQDGGSARVGVTWFTWAPASDPAPGPRWMFGIGRRDGNVIVVESMQMAVRGSYPIAGQQPATFADWGRVEIEFLEQTPDEQNFAELAYAGPAGWGSGVREIKQVTAANSGIPYNIAFSPPPDLSFFYSGGTYSDPTSPGQGWILNHYWRDEPSSVAGFGKRVETGLLWFTYDDQQRPTWSLGIDPDLVDGILEFPTFRATSGGTFEGGIPVLERWLKVYIRGSGGPPFGINCGEPRFIRFVADLIGTPPPTFDVPIARITRTFDPHVAAPELCFS
jgi:hypothetical protein